jgi:hypothetical protein
MARFCSIKNREVVFRLPLSLTLVLFLLIAETLQRTCAAWLRRRGITLTAQRISFPGSRSDWLAP